MIRGIDNYTRVALVCIVLGVVGSSEVSMSFCSTWSSISSLVPLSVAFLGFSFLIAVIGKVSFLSTVETTSFSFAPVFFLLRDSVVLGGIVGVSLVVIVILWAPRSWLDDCI